MIPNTPISQAASLSPPQYGLLPPPAVPEHETTCKTSQIMRQTEFERKEGVSASDAKALKDRAVIVDLEFLVTQLKSTLNRRVDGDPVLNYYNSGCYACSSEPALIMSIAFGLPAPVLMFLCFGFPAVTFSGWIICSAVATLLFNIAFGYIENKLLNRRLDEANAKLKPVYDCLETLSEKIDLEKGHLAKAIQRLKSIAKHTEVVPLELIIKMHELYQDLSRKTDDKEDPNVIKTKMDSIVKTLEDLQNEAVRKGCQEAIDAIQIEIETNQMRNAVEADLESQLIKQYQT